MVDFSAAPSKFRSEFELVSAELFLWRWKVCESWCIDYCTFSWQRKICLLLLQNSRFEIYHILILTFSICIVQFFFNKNACFGNTAHLIEQSSVFIVERIFQLSASVFSTNEFSERTNFLFGFLFFLNWGAVLQNTTSLITWNSQEWEQWKGLF